MNDTPLSCLLPFWFWLTWVGRQKDTDASQVWSQKLKSREKRHFQPTQPKHFFHQHLATAVWTSNVRIRGGTAGRG